MSLKNITHILNTETLASMTTHDSVDDLNATYWAQVTLNGDQLTKLEREVYYRLNQFALRYIGVTYLSANKLATIVGCGRATIFRAFKKLRTLGMIEVHNAKRRSDNRQTSNIVRILPLPIEETAATNEIDNGVPQFEDTQPANDSQGTIENDPQVAQQNDSPLISSLLSSFSSSSKTFDATPNEILSAFNVGTELARAIQPLAIPVEQRLELLTKGIVNHVRSVLSRQFPLLVRNFDLLAYIRQIESAAIRTAYVAKKKNLRSITGYFLSVVTSLVCDEMAQMAAELAMEKAEGEGLSGYAAIVYGRYVAQECASGEGLVMVRSIIDECYIGEVG
ncbi:hypothetical protein [Exiguobacterium sp. LL15]|uniref:hypothetical protein n=1 Tax=Exiguobacterium sp. LL15 TaxID=2950547 RepID=UPI00210E7653|nr:hypothetical protein [Exiguobacterium sp. LL15]MCQ4089449.1 hypothetical protein [Exiguobacterium sp. LL15]